MKEAAELKAKEEADARARAEEALKQARARVELRVTNASPKRPGACSLCFAARVQDQASSAGLTLSFSSPVFLHVTCASTLFSLWAACADEAQLKNRDSSIKRNTALLRKLRTNVADEGGAALLRELRACNCAKYVSEAAQALAEGKLKSSDVWTAVQLASELHQTYAEAAPLLCAALAKVIPAAGAATAGEGGEPLSAVQRRLKLRLLTELLSVGLSTDISPLVTALRELASDNFIRDKEQFHTSLTLIASFAKHAHSELLLRAALPQSGEAQAEPSSAAAAPPDGASADVRAAAAAEAEAVTLSRSWCFPQDKAQVLVAILSKACDSALAALDDEHTALLAAERENARCLESRGEVPETQAAGYERLRKSYESLLRNASSLTEALGRTPPAYPEDAVTRLAPGGASTGELGRLESLRAASDAAALEAGPWDDEDHRAFYTSLPELRAMVPAVLLGGAADGGSERDLTAVPGADAAVPSDAPDASDAMAVPAGQSGEVATQAVASGSDAPTDKDDPSGGAALGQLLTRLGSCLSRDDCEAFVLDFCYLNSRPARKRLVRELLHPRWPAQQQPFLCRIAAGLATVARDVGPPLVAAAEDEAAQLRSRKPQDVATCEARCRNASLIGELTKFKLAPPGLALGMLKSLLDDFTGHNVDVAAALLDSCGRYLCRTAESAVRANALVDVLGRLKQARNLDARQAALVDSAYLACRPPARGTAAHWRRKERPPMLEFIRHVVFTRLGRDTLEGCVRLLRRIPWTPVHEEYLLKCLLKTHKMRAASVPCVAALVASLSRVHDSLAVAMVDDTLEAIREGMATNALSQQQRRVAQARLLGELLHHRLVHADAVFSALWLILTHGYDAAGTGDPASGMPQAQPPSNTSGGAAQGGDSSLASLWPAWDPPEDCFRIRLMVTLLNVAGPLCDRGPAKVKLDKFLAYFQRYVLSKPSLPLDQAFDVADLLAKLLPHGPVHATFADAADAVARSEAQEAATAAARTGSGAMAAVEEDEEDEGSYDEQDDDSSLDDDISQDDDDAMDMDDDEEEEGEEEEEEEGEEGSSEEESEDEDDPLARRHRGPRNLVPAEEADAFERDMAAVLAEAGQMGAAVPGGAVARPPPVVGLRPLARNALPVMSLGVSPAATASTPAAGGSASTAATGGPGVGSSAGQGESEGGTMAFRMLTRRGGSSSSASRVLNVPVASEMVTTVVAHQEAEEAERSQLKRLVLDQVALSESMATAADSAAYPPGRVLMSTGAQRGAGSGSGSGSAGSRWSGTGRAPRL